MIKAFLHALRTKELLRLRYFASLFSIPAGFILLGLISSFGILALTDNMILSVIAFFPFFGLFVISIWAALTMRLRNIGVPCPTCWASALMLIYAPCAAYVPRNWQEGFIAQYWPELVLAVILAVVGSIRPKTANRNH